VRVPRKNMSSEFEGARVYRQGSLSDSNGKSSNMSIRGLMGPEAMIKHLSCQAVLLPL
jgi:hypothetical protein